MDNLSEREAVIESSRCGKAGVPTLPPKAEYAKLHRMVSAGLSVGTGGFPPLSTVYGTDFAQLDRSSQKYRQCETRMGQLEATVYKRKPTGAELTQGYALLAEHEICAAQTALTGLAQDVRHLPPAPLPLMPPRPSHPAKPRPPLPFHLPGPASGQAHHQAGGAPGRQEEGHAEQGGGARQDG